MSVKTKKVQTSKEEVVLGDLRQKMVKLLEVEFPKVMDNFSKLEPKQQITLWLKLAEYMMPKMRYVEYDIEKVLYRVEGLPEVVEMPDN